MAESIVSGVATRIGDSLVQEGKFLSGVSKQVELLQTELKLVRGLLKDSDARQDESEAIRQWFAELRDLAYEAEYIIANYALKVRSRKGRGVQKVLKRYACILCEGIIVHKVGSQIEDIRAKVSNLKTSFPENGPYGTKESTCTVIEGGRFSYLKDSQQEQRQTFYQPVDEVVGFDDDLNYLVEFLLTEAEGLRVATICGMGGLGKTTLAKMVYNHLKVKQHFDCFAWICISQQCQKRQVWEDILISLVSKYQRDQIKEWSNLMLVKEIRQVQQDQKCLVVLDSIWKIEDWNILCEVFPMKGTESKILITSNYNPSRYRGMDVDLDPSRYRGTRYRGMDVDPSMGLLYRLACLNPENSWELLGKLAISRRSEPMIKSCMTEFGKEMIEYCGGLPLAITLLGGLLATKQTREDWEDVHKFVKSYFFVLDLRVYNVIALCYNDLPSHLKQCFLYLAHFPEDFEIPTKKLIQMWMAEGFISQIQHGGGREDTMEDVGNRYLRELIQRCMVQVGKRGSRGRIKTCRMHDLMQSFCVSKAQEEKFLHITNTLSMKQREEQNGRVQRLAIISESNDNSIHGIEFNEYPYLRSLLHLLPWHDESYFEESCFKKFKLVRVLHLENFKKHNRKLPKDIGCLIFLRYLSLKDSNIDKVPSSISNLRFLETLDLRISFSKPRVPNVFKYMKKLRHLYLPDNYSVGDKLELAHLCYLQTLVNVKPKTIQIPTWFKLNRLWVLKVMSNEPAQDAIQKLISRCPRVEKLNLYQRMKLPEAHQFSLNLAKLTLSWTYLEEDPMPTLERLPNLKILRLFYESFVGRDMVCSEGGFPLLQYLLLDHLGKLEEWRVEEGAMPNLCYLEISYCENLKAIPDGLRFVTTLWKLETSLMPRSFKDRLGGPDFYKVQHVPSLAIR